MTDLLTFIEETEGTSLKIEETSKDLLEFADALVESAAAKARAEIERQSDVEYIPKKEAIDLLGVCCDPMALGSFGLSRPRQARPKGVIPSYRHPAAPEPLMLLSAKR